MRTKRRPRNFIPRRALAAILGALLLAGCAGASHVGESWQCPIAQGAACQSVSDADPAVPVPDKPEEPAPATPPRSADTTGTAYLSGLLAWFAELLGFGEERREEAATAEPLFELPETATTDPADETLRTEELIARIWIAPFVDAQDNYHEGYWVRAVIEPARWRLP